MIDIHSHILPALDDGAANINDALELCQFAVDNGISRMLATPHIHPGRYENNKAKIAAASLLLKKELLNNHIPLQIAFSAEVRVSVEMMEMITRNEIPFVGHYRGFHFLLLEMPHSHILPGSEKLIAWLLKRKIKVIIAHPERNKEIQHDISKLIPFVKQGCLLQLTAASVSGKFGEICQDISRQLIDNHWVSFIATDAHNIKNRPPDLKQAMDTLKNWIGEKLADQMCYANPKIITSIHFPRQNKSINKDHETQLVIEQDEALDSYFGSLLNYNA